MYQSEKLQFIVETKNISSFSTTLIQCADTLLKPSLLNQKSSWHLLTDSITLSAEWKQIHPDLWYSIKSVPQQFIDSSWPVPVIFYPEAIIGNTSLKRVQLFNDSTISRVIGIGNGRSLYIDKMYNCSLRDEHEYYEKIELMIVDNINTDSILKLRSIIRPRFTIVLNNRADTLTKFSNILHLDSLVPLLQFQIAGNGRAERVTPK